MNEAMDNWLLELEAQEPSVPPSDELLWYELTTGAME